MGIVLDTEIRAILDQVKRGGFVDQRRSDKLNRRLAPVGCTLVALSVVFPIVVVIVFLATNG